MMRLFAAILLLISPNFSTGCPTNGNKFWSSATKFEKGVNVWGVGISALLVEDDTYFDYHDQFASTSSCDPNLGGVIENGGTKLHLKESSLSSTHLPLCQTGIGSAPNYCPNEFLLIGGYCFHVGTCEKNFQDAESYCQGVSAQLAYGITHELALRLSTLTEFMEQGAQGTKYCGECRSDSSQRNCIEFPTANTPTYTSENPACDLQGLCIANNDTWSASTGSCFRYVDEDLTWGEAYDRCVEKANADYAGIAVGRIGFLSDQDLIDLLTPITTSQQPWIGLKYKGTGSKTDTNNWKWTERNVFGTEFAARCNLVVPSNSYHSDSANEDCMRLDAGGFNDFSCDSDKPYLCEFIPNGQPKETCGSGCAKSVLNSVANGQLEPDQSFYRPGDVVTLYCDPGFSPADASKASVICEYDLSWSAFPTTCSNDGCPTAGYVRIGDFCYKEHPVGSHCCQKASP